MITLQDAIRIHEILIMEFGGGSGIRDLNALKAAINRPYATFEEKDLYKTPFEKSAAILESILINHPFIDGNKRTGYTLMRLMLLSERLDIVATQKDKYEFVMQIAKGELKIEAITEWINERIKS